ncbi:uncharacterized protein LOC133179097 [Saccostrea echinata]|uniref:uncharacterized protein LOC133179097 n=1 Tax=Saccostrea echinata TaxID=191078 RepID=UPI002A7F44AF|nr:uncharacterized protein LOC133179097 [Saccostrea echinata]
MNSLCIIGITCLSVCLSGVSSECNLTEVNKCFQGYGMMDTSSTPDPQTVCKSVRELTSCIEPHKSACAANPTFQTMMSGMAESTGFCGGDPSCNVMKCFTDAGYTMDSSGSGSPNMSCEVYLAVKPCLDSQGKMCEGNTLYSKIQGFLQPVEKLCGSPGCNIDECNIDFSFPNGFPSKSKYNMGCTAMKAAIPCLETKSKCPNLKALASLTKGYRSFCEDTNLKKGLETHMMCLKNATVNAKCNKYLSPSMSDSNMDKETEKEECQRIEDYAMCAKKAVSVCDNEEAMNFAAETARKVLFLKSSREGGIVCATGGGISAAPVLWVLFPAAMVALAAIFP